MTIYFEFLQAGVTQTPVPDATSPAAAYQAFSQSAELLHTQLEGLLDQRGEIIRQLGNLTSSQLTGTSKAGLDERLARLDKRIAGMDEQIAQADAQVAKAAAVPGAYVPRVDENQTDNEGEAFAGGLGTAAVLLVLWMLVGRRLWRWKWGKGGPKVVANSLPGDMSARMANLENMVESSAVEIERIGEGQRFITKLLSENAGKRIGDGAEVART